MAVTKKSKKSKSAKKKERRKVEYNLGMWMFPWEPEKVTHYID